MSSKIAMNYDIYQSKATYFLEAIEELLVYIKEDIQLVRLVFFVNVKDNEEYLKYYEQLDEVLGSRYIKLPSYSMVAQTPFQATVLMEVHYFYKESGYALSYKKWKNISYVTAENKTYKALYVGGLRDKEHNEDISIQAEKVFVLLGEILKIEGMRVDSIVRQWNYIERLTSISPKGQHYQLFNNARSHFYEGKKWSKGYPAATGIGVKYGGVLVDADVIETSDKEFQIKAIDNKKQIAAYAYSDGVLVEAEQGKTTPKFERAKIIGLPGNELVYVSGTAAIKGEKSCVSNDVLMQYQWTMENIEELIGNKSMKVMRCYLKNLNDAIYIKPLMELLKPIAYFLVEADVCREELLIEIEGIAK